MVSFKKIVFLIILPFLAFSSHKYYLSLTDIEYNIEKNSLEIIINLFMDDLEYTVNKDFEIDLKLSTKDELKNADKYFKNYLNKNLTFKIDNKQINFDYIGKEYEGDLIYFYLEIDSVNNPNSLELSNKLLLKYFKKQQNVVKLKNGKNRQSEILTYETNKALLNF